MSIPAKGIAHEFYVALDDVTGTNFKSNPTIAVGDFTISKDGGAFTNLVTTPTVDPTSSIAVNVSLTAEEMDADKIVIYAKDLSGDEWEELVMTLDVPDTGSTTGNPWDMPTAGSNTIGTYGYLLQSTFVSFFNSIINSLTLLGAKFVNNLTGNQPNQK